MTAILTMVAMDATIMAETPSMPAAKIIVAAITAAKITLAAITAAVMAAAAMAAAEEAAAEAMEAAKSNFPQVWPPLCGPHRSL
jgi:hypothetical protein